MGGGVMIGAAETDHKGLQPNYRRVLGRSPVGRGTEDLSTVRKDIADETRFTDTADSCFAFGPDGRDRNGPGHRFHREVRS